MPLHDADERRARVRLSRLKSRELDEAREIVTMLEAGRYRAADGSLVDIAGAVRLSVEQAIVTSPDVFSNVDVPSTFSARLAVTRDTTIGCALALAARRGDVAVLNFASGRSRGGSWNVGAKSQEEDLIRASTLLESLDRSMAADAFYSAHAQAGAPGWADLCLHSPGVLLVRGDEGKLLDHPASVAVLTCPAPIADGFPSAEDPSLVELIHGRLDLILATAVFRAHRALVLGAWGCGEYGNAPAVVAGAFASLLGKKYARAFDQVIFAMHDRSEGRAVESAFVRVFPDDRAVGG